MQEAESYRKKILVSSMLGLGLEGMDILLLSFALSSISYFICCGRSFTVSHEHWNVGWRCDFWVLGGQERQD